MTAIDPRALARVVGGRIGLPLGPPPRRKEPEDCKNGLASYSEIRIDDKRVWHRTVCK